MKYRYAGIENSSQNKRFDHKLNYQLDSTINN